MNVFNPKVVVSAILERNEGGERQVFVQTRNKPDSSPKYFGMLEIPAGGVEPFENVYDALRREVKEETGLRVVKIYDEDSVEVFEIKEGEKSMAFRPYMCQQVLAVNGGLPWYGFVFRCLVEGEIEMNKAEAVEGRWLNVGKLREFLEMHSEKVFTLQYATLKKYVDEFCP